MNTSEQELVRKKKPTWNQIKDERVFFSTKILCQDLSFQWKLM